jgi:hypothetical protein
MRPNNAPQILPRDPRNRERDDQRVQAPFQNILVVDEEEEEVEADPEIHFLGDTSPSPHLTQPPYEKSLMDIKINELIKGEKAKENTNRYNLRSKNYEEKNDAPNQTAQKEAFSKAIPVSSKEKDSQSSQVLIINPSPETKEILKPSSSFSFEDEIQKIKIPIPFLELIKNEEFKKYLSKMLQPEASPNAIDSVNMQDEKPAVILGPLIEDRDDSSPPFYTSLNIHDKVLHNCLIDSVASHNLMHVGHTYHT